MDEELFTKHPNRTWVPVYTLSRNEKKVFEKFSAADMPVYLPMKKQINIQPVFSKGKNYCYKRELHVPMFPGYLFAGVSPEDRYRLMMDRSVIRIFSLSSAEEDVLLQELQIIRRMEAYAENEEIDVVNGLQIGQKVLFTDGMFAGWEGVVVSMEGSGFVGINISSIQASVKMKYPAAWCRLREDQN